MKKSVLFASIAVVVVTATTTAMAETRQSSARREFGYFLPKARVAAAVTQQIIRCPANGEPPIVETTIEIGSKTAPDPSLFVRVDTSHGFLAERSTRLELRQDGTLTGFNASNEGQGGAVIASVISLAASVAPMFVGLPPAPVPAVRGAVSPPAPRPPLQGITCNAETASRIAERDRVSAEIAALRTRISAGNEPPAAGLALTGLEAELERLIGRLTLAADGARFDVARPAARQAPAPAPIHIAPIDYSPWFGARCETDPADRGLPRRCGADGRAGYRRPEGLFVGDRGFRASLAPNMPLYRVLSQGDGSAAPEQDQRVPATPYLVYLRPVPAAVAVEPCKSVWTGRDCAIDDSPEASDATAQGTALLPQLSGFYSIRIGRGGLFGSQQAEASFDAQGAPTALEYGSSSGGAEIAAAIDAASAAAPAIRDARTTADTAQINRRKARAELTALLNPPAPDPAPAADPDQ